MLAYQVKSPVLFLLFNRPELTRKTFERIRAAQPARLYVAADGPRKSHAADADLCAQARAAVQIDWPCDYKLLYRPANLGCRSAVSAAVSWFFAAEKEGIILEDDCLPHTDFFRFCDALLDRYRNDARVRSITGSNLFPGKKWGSASYYFSQHANVWGWATWKRVWDQYDPGLRQYRPEDVPRLLANVFPDPFLVKVWLQHYHDLRAEKVDTWDYQLQLANFFENGLCAVPNVNLVSNMGFGDDSTHTCNALSPNAALPADALGDITHPYVFAPEKAADYAFYDREYDLAIQWKRHHKLKKRFSRWMQTFFRHTTPF
ncbi:hypothetical protein ACWKWU_00690 [Chitinophaga lutea]